MGPRDPPAADRVTETGSMTPLHLAHRDPTDIGADGLPDRLDELQRDLAALRQRIWRTRDTCDMRRARQIEMRISQIGAGVHP